MIRTQVYIPDDIYRDLTLLAKFQKKNISQLIREGAREVLRKDAQTQRKNTKAWGKYFFGAGKGGPKNLATNIDRYLYGDLSSWGK